jgi:outer membrane protein TolC
MFHVHMFPVLLICHALVAQAPENVKALSLQEALRISLENNLQVEIAKETRTATEGGVPIAQGAFDWTALGNVSVGRQESATTQYSSSLGALERTEATSRDRNLSLGVQKPFEWGGNLRVNYNPIYSSSNGSLISPSTGVVVGTFNTANPYTGSLSATYTQSLLKGFGRDATEVNVIVAKKSSEAATYQYQIAIINLVASTESQYWDLVFALRNLDNAKVALALAQKQLNENKIRVDVGTLAPIEVTSAEAAVALQEQVIIAAEAQLQNANDALIRALYPVTTGRPDRLEPTDAPTLSHIQVDEPTAEKMALDRRVELKVAKLSKESASALRVAAENRTKPQLDAFVAYDGLSDNYNSLGSVNSDLSQSRYPGYSVGLAFSFPIPNRTARGNLAQAHANERSSELSLKDQELGILLQVRQAFRNVDASEKGVEAARKTRVFREKDLDAEQKKFENGMSTNFLVLSKQNDLDAARAAELQAQITYAKSVTAQEQSVGNLMEARGFQYPQ